MENDIVCVGCGVSFVKNNTKMRSSYCSSCLNKKNRDRRRSPEHFMKHNKTTLEKFGREAFDKMPSCRICEEQLGFGYRSNDLSAHLKLHDIDAQEYKDKYNSPIRSESYLKDQSERVKGDKNPASGHDGSLSPYSYKFYMRRGHSEEDAKALALSKSRELHAGMDSSKYNSTLAYWVEKCGGDVEEGKRLYKDRQQTFSKKICIEKYGEDEGLKVWQERQDKWLETLDNKSDEEKNRIYRAKMGNGRSYSKISQELFVKIYEHIQGNYLVKFATLRDNGLVKDTGENNEYMVNTLSGSVRFLDFYAQDLEGNKYNIEFSGDYWHNNNHYKGNVERDAIRESQIRETMPDICMLEIKECDYKSNPEKVIQECLEFLHASGR